MRKRIIVLIIALGCLAQFQAVIAASSIFGGNVTAAIAHFRSVGFHMRGIVTISEAAFESSDGKTIPYEGIKFSITPTANGGRTVCFEVVANRCDAIPLDPQFVIPIMDWVSNEGTAAFTLAQPRSFAFLKSINMQPVMQGKDVQSTIWTEREYVAAALNTPALIEALKQIDYRNLVGKPDASDEAAAIIKRFNEGVSDTITAIPVDDTYTVNDYFSQFVVRIGDSSAQYSGVPSRLDWELYEGQPPLVTGIRPFLTLSEIDALPSPEFNSSLRFFLSSLKEVWEDHVALCREKGYSARIKAIDHYLAFVKSGSPTSRKEAILKELDEQGLDDFPEKKDRDRFVERQKHCEKNVLDSISEQLKTISASDAQSIERAVAGLPKGFEDIAEQLKEELKEQKEYEARQKVVIEQRKAYQKQVQKKAFDFYYSVAILRGIYNHQRQAFESLSLQLRK